MLVPIVKILSNQYFVNFSHKIVYRNQHINGFTKHNKHIGIEFIFISK